jgi:hypothetical protein
MKPVSPVLLGSNLLETQIAENQDEYQTLPAVYLNGGQEHVSRWEVSAEELATLAETRSLYLHIWTFGNPTQPVLLTVERPLNGDAPTETETEVQKLTRICGALSDRNVELREGQRWAFKFGKAIGAVDTLEIERMVDGGYRHKSGAKPLRYLTHWLKVARFFAYATQDDSWGEFEKLFAIIVKRLVRSEARAATLEAILDREGIAYPKDEDWAA